MLRPIADHLSEKLGQPVVLDNRGGAGGTIGTDLVAKAIAPDVPFRSHSAPLGLTFYTATQFPAQYQGGAFVALHGSWNAAAPRAYDVVYVPFQNKRPEGGYEIFASGFWSGSGDTAEVWGRPASVAVAKDGSLLIADDGSNTIWRVSAKK